MLIVCISIYERKTVKNDECVFLRFENDLRVNTLRYHIIDCRAVLRSCTENIRGDKQVQKWLTRSSLEISALLILYYTYTFTSIGFSQRGNNDLCNNILIISYSWK